MTSPDAATWHAGLADDDGGEWDETRWCPGCGQDRLLGMELVGGRVMNG